ncbi:hypothetical protein BKA59DRAFT_128803 [Fusarium tricinctum]|uniref:Uncharacterized protein n=1 Tax=Fusarium tricinctum TaxID=61284 RepID=A0A8K0RX16_9HYPO|nr:hypothetical protein BKA59DRAFT_128803 [Fusarium tricinctum]
MTSYRLSHLPTSVPPSPERRSAHSHSPDPTHQLTSDEGRRSARTRHKEHQDNRNDDSVYSPWGDVPHVSERVRCGDTRPQSQVPRSQSTPQLLLQMLSSHENQPLQSETELEYEFYQMSPGMQFQASCENTIGPFHDYDGFEWPKTDEAGLAHTGSWCHLASMDFVQERWKFPGTDQDILADDWRPMTPRDTRLSTPDLPPLSTDFEFCPCHYSDETEQERINEDFYFVSRSKMDMQTINALAHIAQTRSTSH